MEVNKNTIWKHYLCVVNCPKQYGSIISVLLTAQNMVCSIVRHIFIDVWHTSLKPVNVAILAVNGWWTITGCTHVIVNSKCEGEGEG